MALRGLIFDILQSNPVDGYSNIGICLHNWPMLVLTIIRSYG